MIQHPHGQLEAFAAGFHRVPLEVVERGKGDRVEQKIELPELLAGVVANGSFVLSADDAVALDVKAGDPVRVLPLKVKQG